MKCPKCPGSMQPATYADLIHIHRCSDCFGLFCHPEALEQMKQEWMSEVLDIGDPKVGRRLDRVEDIDCPECHTAMSKCFDPDQVHIWYEECPQCGGIYFDAGEFHDLKFDTFMDRVRGILKGRRTT